MADPWKFEVHRQDTNATYEVKVPFPKNLSVTGLKNLVQEKTELPSNQQLKLTYTNDATSKVKVVEESTEKFGPMFLRDYPDIKDGCKFCICIESNNK